MAPDADLWARIEAEISGPEPKPDAVLPEAKRRSWFNWNMTLAVAAVFVLVLGIGAVVLSNDDGQMVSALDTTRDLVDPATGEVLPDGQEGEVSAVNIRNEIIAGAKFHRLPGASCIDRTGDHNRWWQNL